jgi:hypothetical protein
VQFKCKSSMTHRGRFASPLAKKSRLAFGTAIALALTALLEGCLIPDDFDLEITVPSARQVSWKFDGKWQFFLVGHDPRKEVIDPNAVIGLTEELAKLPGSTSVKHIEKNIWKQSISSQASLRDNQDRPIPALFPTGTQTADVWLVRISPESADSVLLETVQPPPANELAEFKSMGYKSSGTLRLNTAGTVSQLSGPPLGKSWFGSTYSAKWSALEDQPIKVRIKW